MSVTTFETFSEQAEAKRLLAAALAEGPAHAYLFHGPQGVGKRDFARAFARELLATTREVHPDLYELEALGEMIRIDAIRELRRDLHMRPFEADRRVYLVHDAHLLNEGAADALLKDLEEPPPYAVIVLVADDLGPIPETIRSRRQPVQFRRPSERAGRGARGAACAARGARGVVPRPRRGRRWRRARRGSRRQARGAARRRDARAPPRRGARGRGGPRPLAPAGGVQPGAPARLRGAL